MLLFREGIPSKLLSIEKNPVEAFYVEVNLRKIKWLLGCSYNPNKNDIHAHLENLDRSLALYSSSYENHIIKCDFNVETEYTYIKNFYDNFGLTNFIKEHACFENPENPSWSDLILINRPRSFQNSCAIETGLSYFHKMTLTVRKKSFQKYKHRIIKFRDHRHFQNNAFREPYQKSWTLYAWFRRLDSGRLNSRRLDSVRLGSGRLDSGRMDAWTLDDWTPGLWTLGLRRTGLLDSGHL